MFKKIIILLAFICTLSLIGSSLSAASHPANNSMVYTDTPEFSWDATPGISKYLFVAYSDPEGLKQFFSVWTQGTSYKVPTGYFKCNTNYWWLWWWTKSSSEETEVKDG